MISRDPQPKNPWVRRGLVTGLAASAALLAACNSGENTQATSSDSTPASSSDQVPSTTSSNEIPSGATSVTIEAPSTSSSETEASAPELYVKNADGSVSFPVEAYKDKPEQLVNDFITVGIQGWINAGASPEAIQKAKQDNPNLEEPALSVTIAKANLAEFSPRLFDQSGLDGNTVKDLISEIADANATTIAAEDKSLGIREFYPDAGTDYTYTWDLTSVVIRDTNDLHVAATVTIHKHNNYDESATSQAMNAGSDGFGSIDTTEVRAVNLVAQDDGTYRLDGWRNPS